jgi:hypothetical protein
MHRWYLYLAASIVIISLPVSAIAETVAAAATADARSPDPAATANHHGFYIDLPHVSADQLLGLIRSYRASLTYREEEIRRYLDKNRLDAKDALIAIIMPGGLVYAAIRKGDLEQAEVELADITEDMDELDGDLLTMQAIVGELTVAQLRQ